MTINSYLAGVAQAAQLPGHERTGIDRSVASLGTRLNGYFSSQISQSFVFGSYSRGTILPRQMDSRSDVDVMVVFRDGGLRPQSYLDRLRRFAEDSYSRSEIAQSSPTIVLSLNHIDFELVPALPGFLGDFQIPGKASGWPNWISTNPTDINAQLSRADQSYGSLLRPLIRVMKYWNALQGYPYESFELEKHLAGRMYGFLGILNANPLQQLFFDAVASLHTDWNSPQRTMDAVDRLKRSVTHARQLEYAGNQFQAEDAIRKILPVNFVSR